MLMSIHMQLLDMWTMLTHWLMLYKDHRSLDMSKKSKEMKESAMRMSSECECAAGHVLMNTHWCNAQNVIRINVTMLEIFWMDSSHVMTATIVQIERFETVYCAVSCHFNAETVQQYVTCCRAVQSMWQALGADGLIFMWTYASAWQQMWRDQPFVTEWSRLTTTECVQEQFNLDYQSCRFVGNVYVVIAVDTQAELCRQNADQCISSPWTTAVHTEWITECSSTCGVCEMKSKVWWTTENGSSALHQSNVVM